MANAETSVPEGPIIANNESTLADSPSRSPTYKSVPDWKDSNSIVALSVSISAKISPSSTASPTCFNQVATVPSSMVSLNLGIVTTVTPSGISTAVVEVASVSVFSSEDASSLGTSSAPLNNAEMSSPSSPIIANKASTLVVSPS